MKYIGLLFVIFVMTMPSYLIGTSLDSESYLMEPIEQVESGISRQSGQLQPTSNLATSGYQIFNLTPNRIAHLGHFILNSILGFLQLGLVILLYLNPEICLYTDRNAVNGIYAIIAISSVGELLTRFTMNLEDSKELSSVVNAWLNRVLPFFLGSAMMLKPFFYVAISIANGGLCRTPNGDAVLYPLLFGVSSFQFVLMIIYLVAALYFQK